MGTFETKVALVTGGGAGIGRESALAFAREGAKVVVVDWSREGGEQTVALIEAGGGEALFLNADVSRDDQVKAMVLGAVQAYGRLDFAFNNAGLTLREAADLADYSEEEWDRLMAVNLKGVWLCMKHEIPTMLAQGSGVIVNTASTLGLKAEKKLSIYTAAKHGVVGLTKSAAIEYGGRGLRINCICPGIVVTQMTEEFWATLPAEAMAAQLQTIPAGRLGTPKDVAGPLMWLFSEASAYINGHTLVMDGGQLVHSGS
jgi:NAD(P)-dependent dehydrogenase (short-subunit alcohol dehydrogenase family)